MKKYHCQTAMKIIGKLCNRQHTVICPKCSVTTDNIAVHTLQYCRENENVRLKLWQSLITYLNSTTFLSFIQLPPDWQIIEMLCSFPTLILSDIVRILCFHSVLRHFYQMWECSTVVQPSEQSKYNNIAKLNVGRLYLNV